MKIIMKADGADLLMSNHLPDTYSRWCNTTGLEFKVPGTEVSWDFPKQLLPSQQDHNCQIEKGLFLVAVADFFILKRGLKLLLRRVKVVNYSSSNFHHVALLPRPPFSFPHHSTSWSHSFLATKSLTFPWPNDLWAHLLKLIWSHFNFCN